MIGTESIWTKVESHYAQPHLGETILRALQVAGKGTQPLQPADLAPVDEFHVRGRQATVELAEKLALDASKRVLDVGSGLGGPSRYLAATYGCRVTGLDLTRDYVETARMLAEQTGLDRLVEYRQGSGLELPFEDGSFDVVWTQHTAMNIADKSRLYAEFRRVLKPDGQLGLNDILAGPERPVYYPAPWAQDEQTSFLASPDGLRDLLVNAGFHLTSWRDTTEPGRAFFNDLVARVEKNGPPPVGLNLLMGKDFMARVRNVTRNLNEQRIVVIEAVAQAG